MKARGDRNLARERQARVQVEFEVSQARQLRYLLRRNPLARLHRSTPNACGFCRHWATSSPGCCVPLLVVVPTAIEHHGDESAKHDGKRYFKNGIHAFEATVVDPPETDTTATTRRPEIQAKRWGIG
jgi:hypothetical protein